jgi:AcrR family transcriptional regulator
MPSSIRVMRTSIGRAHEFSDRQLHRREVRDAILDTMAALVAEHGLLGVTMSQIAEETGIGRATLYKYFPDVEAILLAWHDRQFTAHIGDSSGSCG